MVSGIWPVLPLFKHAMSSLLVKYGGGGYKKIKKRNDVKDVTGHYGMETEGRNDLSISEVKHAIIYHTKLDKMCLRWRVFL